MRARRPVAMACFLAALLIFAGAGSAWAGTFAFPAGGAASVSSVTHAEGYTGTGGAMSVSVCIVEGTENDVEMAPAIQNAIAAYNALTPTTGNLVLGGANNIPSGYIDLESVAVHELGHCLGLGHVNLASESGVSQGDRDYTKSTTGGDAVYDLDSGTDAVLGSSDDVRGDDANLHWFRDATNDPFTIDDPVDTTTYSLNLANLPPGHTYAASGGRAVAAVLGVPDTESVMNQGTGYDEAQRTLTHDDVATLLYARSGIDETAGTGDDYTLEVVFGGLGNCDIDVVFSTGTGFASCTMGGTQIATGHDRITSATMRFNPNYNWFFNSLSGPGCGDGNTDPGEDCDDGNLVNGDCCSSACQFELDGASCEDADACTVGDTCDGAGTCDTGVDPLDCDDGNVCTDDSCEPASGCVYAGNTDLCDDGIGCTTGDVCSLGECAGTWEPAACALDHFKMYKAKLASGETRFVPVTVTLADQFRTSDASVSKETLLGVPADKNGEGINVPEVHLECFKRKDVAGSEKFARRIVESTNQFGTRRLRLGQPRELCVPAAKDELAPPAPLGVHEVDHFQCYKAKKDKGEAPFVVIDVTVADQLDSKNTRVLKTDSFCNPVGVDGEAVLHADDHLHCYKIKDVKGQDRFERTTVFMNNRFGDDTLTILKSRRLCVPSSKTDLGEP